MHLKISSMSIQIFLHSNRLKEYLNHSKEEFLTSYAPQTLKCITSYCNASKIYKKNTKTSEQEKITTSRPRLLSPPVDAAPPEAPAATVHPQQGCTQISTSTSMSGPITY